MKRLLACALALFASFAFAATTTPISLLSPAGSAAGQVITSNGSSAVPTWSSVTLDGIGGFNTTGFVYRNSANSYVIITPPIIQGVGGTGLSNITAHQLVVGGSGNAMTAITPGAAGTIFSSNGAAADPSYRTLASLGLASTGANTLTGNQTVSTNSASFTLNDAGGTGFPAFFFNKAGVNVWAFTNNSSTGAFTLNRSISGTLVDSPISVSNTTGVTAFSARPTFAGNVPFDTGNLSNSAQLATALSDETGTGVAVFNAAPALTAPVITGVADGSNAASGKYGEYVTATASTVALTTGTPINITSISLTPGDWDVSGAIQFFPAVGTTLTAVVAGTNSASATLGPLGSYTSMNVTVIAAQGETLVAPVTRYSVSSTTTVFLIASSNFSGSTETASGFIRARRVR